MASFYVTEKSTGRKFKVLVDDEDLEKCLKYKDRWRVSRARTHDGPSAEKARIWASIKSRQMYIYRYLLGKYPQGYSVDHINGNTLDNRKANLRVTPVRHNSLNKVKAFYGKYNYKGLYQTSANKWATAVQRENRRYFASGFDTELQAAKAYNFLADM